MVLVTTLLMGCSQRPVAECACYADGGYTTFRFGTFTQEDEEKFQEFCVEMCTKYKRKGL